MQEKKPSLLKGKYCSLILHGTEESDYYFFLFCGATVQLSLGSLIVETFRSHTVRQAQVVGHFRTSDQLVTGAALNPPDNKHKKRTSILPAKFEIALPVIEPL